MAVRASPEPGGARALGLENEIGTLEPGKRADVIVIRLDALHSTPAAIDPVSTVVYSTQTADVQHVIIDGNVVLRDGDLVTMDESEVIEEAVSERQELVKRAGIGN